MDQVNWLILNHQRLAAGFSGFALRRRTGCEASVSIRAVVLAATQGCGSAFEVSFVWLFFPDSQPPFSSFLPLKLYIFLLLPKSPDPSAGSAPNS